MVPLLSELHIEEPQRFYLGSSGLDELANGRIKLGEVVLPFHSQIVAAQSSVLRDLFRSLRTAEDSAAQAGMIEVGTLLSSSEFAGVPAVGYHMAADPTDLRANLSYCCSWRRLSRTLALRRSCSCCDSSITPPTPPSPTLSQQQRMHLASCALHIPLTCLAHSWQLRMSSWATR